MKKLLIELLKQIQKQNKEGRVYLETIDSDEDSNTVSVFSVKGKRSVHGIASNNLDYLFSITVNNRLYEKYLR